MLVGLIWISSEYTRADSQQWIVAFYFGLVLPRRGGWIEQITRTSPAGESAGILLAIATFLSATHIVFEAASASVVNVLLACTSILAAILLAQLMFVWIETPFMALGKHVSQRLTGLGYSPHLHRSKDGVA